MQSAFFITYLLSLRRESNNMDECSYRELRIAALIRDGDYETKWILSLSENIFRINCNLMRIVSSG